MCPQSPARYSPVGLQSIGAAFGMRSASTEPQPPLFTNRQQRGAGPGQGGIPPNPPPPSLSLSPPPRPHVLCMRSCLRRSLARRCWGSTRRSSSPSCCASAAPWVFSYRRACRAGTGGAAATQPHPAASSPAGTPCRSVLQYKAIVAHSGLGRPGLVLCAGLCWIWLFML